MRPRILLCILTLAAATLLVIFWLRPVHSPNGAREPQATNQTGNVLVPNEPSVRKINKQGASSNRTTTPTLTPAESSAAYDARTRSVVQEFVANRNQPINFYGLVIDQDSNALSGVHIRSSVGQLTVADPTVVEMGLGSKQIPIERTTGTDGRFEINGVNGTGFGVLLFKDGYEAESQKNGFGGGQSGSYEAPIIFKMWNTNIHEKLITGGKSFDIIPDGRPYFINFTDDTISESGTGDLKVWIQYTNKAVPGQLYDWCAGIEVVNGGLMEKELGSPMYEAPTDGYIPNFAINSKLKGGHRGDTGDRQFYLKLKGGEEYGEMTIDLHAPFNSQTPGLIRLSYAINPSGSRILR